MCWMICLAPTKEDHRSTVEQCEEKEEIEEKYSTLCPRAHWLRCMTFNAFEIVVLKPHSVSSENDILHPFPFSSFLSTLSHRLFFSDHTVSCCEALVMPKLPLEVLHLIIQQLDERRSTSEPKKGEVHQSGLATMMRVSKVGLPSLQYVPGSIFTHRSATSLQPQCCTVTSISQESITWTSFLSDCSTHMPTTGRR